VTCCSARPPHLFFPYANSPRSRSQHQRFALSARQPTRHITDSLVGAYACALIVWLQQAVVFWSALSVRTSQSSSGHDRSSEPQETKADGAQPQYPSEDMSKLHMSKWFRQCALRGSIGHQLPAVESVFAQAFCYSGFAFVSRKGVHACMWQQLTFQEWSALSIPESSPLGF